MLYDILIHHGIVTCRLYYGLCASVDGGGGGGKAENTNISLGKGRCPLDLRGPVNNLDPRPFFQAAGSAPGWVLENGVLWEWGLILIFGLDVSCDSWSLEWWSWNLNPLLGHTLRKKVGPTTSYAIWIAPGGHWPRTKVWGCAALKNPFTPRL